MTDNNEVKITVEGKLKDDSGHHLVLATKLASALREQGVSVEVVGPEGLTLPTDTSISGDVNVTVFVKNRYRTRRKKNEEATTTIF